MEAGLEEEPLPSAGRVRRVRVAFEGGARPEGRPTDVSEELFGLTDGLHPEPAQHRSGHLLCGCG